MVCCLVVSLCCLWCSVGGYVELVVVLNSCLIVLFIMIFVVFMLIWCGL